MCPNSKNKVRVTPPLLSLPLTAHLWHIFGWLGKSILFSAPEILAMDTSTCCTNGKGRGRGEDGGKESEREGQEVKDVDVQS